MPTQSRRYAEKCTTGTDRGPRSAAAATQLQSGQAKRQRESCKRYECQESWLNTGRGLMSSLHLERQSREIALPINARLVRRAQLGSTQQPLAGPSYFKHGTAANVGFVESAIGFAFAHNAQRKVGERRLVSQHADRELITGAQGCWIFLWNDLERHADWLTP